jgi:hypothetical protein
MDSLLQQSFISSETDFFFHLLLLFFLLPLLILFFYFIKLNDTLYVPIPVNIETVNKFYNQNIQDEAHMKEFMNAIQVY